jgi:hypothetical protein
LSFDIFFQPCRYTIGLVDQKGRTEEDRSVLTNEPLNGGELEAVQATLLKVRANGPDEHACYVVAFSDDGGADVFASKLANGCMVAIRGMTPQLVQFLFDLLVAGKWVMLPIMAETVAITYSMGNVFGIPYGFPTIVECASAEELGVILSEGVQAWERYRDKVVGQK